MRIPQSWRARGTWMNAKECSLVRSDAAAPVCSPPITGMSRMGWYPRMTLHEIQELRFKLIFNLPTQCDRFTWYLVTMKRHFVNGCIVAISLNFCLLKSVRCFLPVLFPLTCKFLYINPALIKRRWLNLRYLRQTMKSALEQISMVTVMIAVIISRASLYKNFALFLRCSMSGGGGSVWIVSIKVLNVISC